MGNDNCDCGKIEHGRHHMSCPALKPKHDAFEARLDAALSAKCAALNLVGRPVTPMLVEEVKHALTQAVRDVEAEFISCFAPDCALAVDVTVEGTDSLLVMISDKARAADGGMPPPPAAQSDRWVIRYTAMFGAPWYCRDNGEIAVMTRAEAEAEQAAYRRDRLAAGMDDDIGEIVHADTVDLTQKEDDED